MTGSTPPAGIETEVVAVNRDAMDDALRDSASRAGKALFLTSRGSKAVDGRAAYAQLGRLVTAAQKGTRPPLLPGIHAQG
jgi:hypothetical protein